MINQRKWKETLPRLALTLALAALAVGMGGDLRARYLPIIQKGTLLPRSMLAAMVVSLGFLALTLLQIWYPRFFTFFNRVRGSTGVLRWAAALAVGVFTSWFFLYTKWSDVFSGFYMRLVFYLLTLWAMAWLATSNREEIISWHGLLISLTLFSSVFILANAMTSVVSYPFGLYWSEGNRLWDYSVLYGARLYDYSPEGQIIAYIDRGRQSLWGLPFLFNNVTIAGVRFWSSFLFTIPYLLLGLFAFYDIKKDHPWLWLLAGLWTMIFLNQGPIYTPLVLIAILVACTRKMPTWLGALFVILASYYATVSRSTWIFAPGIWSAVIAFVEVHPRGVRSPFQRWLRAIIFGLAGLFGSLGIRQMVAFIGSLKSGAASGGATSQLGLAISAVGRQPLLWDRLLPNSTYAPGILLGLLIVAGPLILLLLVSSAGGRWKLNLWQKLALWGSSLAFLAVGIVVSVKIGGGSNLHNLDMFLISLVFSASLAWEAGIFQWIFEPAKKRLLENAMLFLLLATGATQSILSATPRNLPSPEKADEALSAIRSAMAAVQGDPILFIDQRQLLTFGAVPRVPLIPEYEKKYMMDEAMADDAAYFEPFIRDLHDHRFSVIISEPLWIRFQGGSYNFGNENDAWVKWVSIPVLCYYQPTETFLDVGIQILVPRTDPLKDPGVTCPAP